MGGTVASWLVRLFPERVVWVQALVWDRTYTKHGPGSMDHPMDQATNGPPWTTHNFQKEIAPVKMKIYQRSGYEKHRFVFFHQYTLITKFVLLG